jgi:hypothetical protein
MESLVPIWEIPSDNRFGGSSNSSRRRTLPGNERDKEIVNMVYCLNPVPGFAIDTIYVIDNHDQSNNFKKVLSLLQEQSESQNIKIPDWHNMNNHPQRGEIMDWLHKTSEAYQDNRYPNVRILPTWNAVLPSHLESVKNSGYMKLEGNFGLEYIHLVKLNMLTGFVVKEYWFLIG